jgi:hypothetical protein
MKALSLPIFMVLMFILLVAVLIPAYLIFNSVQLYNYQGSQQAVGYLQGQTQETNNVFRGNPNVYLNSSKTPYLEIQYTSIPYPLNITQVYYFNGTSWVPVLYSPRVIAGDGNILLPTRAYNQPVLIVSGNGNIYFLEPNTSIDTVNVQGPSGKVPVYIASFVINGSKVYPVSTQVVFGVGGGQTPLVCYVLPGTYPLDEKQNSTFLPQYGLTGVFQNWSVVGYGQLSGPNRESTYLTVSGPVVVTAIYKAYEAKYQVTIKPSGLSLNPLTSNIHGSSSITLNPLNTTVPVIIDNKTYHLGGNGITLNLTYGYHLIQFPKYYNITFNYSFTSNGNSQSTHTSNGNSQSTQFSVYAGEINCYQFTALTPSIKNTTVYGQDVVFVAGNGTVYGNYSLHQVYYAVLVNNSFFYPSGVTVYYSNPPSTGDVPGQLVQINNSFVIGPTAYNQNERLYFKNWTILKDTYVYLNQLSGNFNINGQPYSVLLSQPFNVYAKGLITNNGLALETINFNEGSEITIISPFIITDYQEWFVGGEPL